MTSPNIPHLIHRVLTGEIEAIELLIQYNKERAISSEDFKTIQKEIIIISPNNPLYSNALTVQGILNEFDERGIVDVNMSIRLFEQAILLNNGLAMYYRANFYYKGIGSDVNYAAAIKLYEDAAALKIPPALFELGKIFQNGLENINADIPRAIKYFDNAIELKWPAAMVARADLYRRGIGSRVSLESAAGLYQRAADLNDKTALLSLARMYRLGINGQKNIAQAIQLYSKAAALNCTISMMELADIYEREHGIFADLNKAIGLYYKVYCLQPSNNPKKLIDACNKSTTNKSKRILFTIYLDNEDLEKISDLFNDYSACLSHLLYKKIIALIDLEIDNAFRKSLIDLFLDSDAPYLIHSSRLKYLEFKLALHNYDRENALKIYSTYLAHSNDLSANDYYRLGNLELDGNISLTDERRIARINQACYFYYNAYKKGDKEIFSLLIRLLRRVQTIKNKEQKFTDEQLFNQFIDLISMEHNETQKKHITAFETYIFIKKHEVNKNSCWPALFHSRPNYSLIFAKKIVQQLMQNIPLEDIINKEVDLSLLVPRDSLLLLIEKLINSKQPGEVIDEKENLIHDEPIQSLVEGNETFSIVYSFLNTCIGGCNLTPRRF